MNQSQYGFVRFLLVAFVTIISASCNSDTSTLTLTPHPSTVTPTEIPPEPIVLHSSVLDIHINKFRKIDQVGEIAPQRGMFLIMEISFTNVKAPHDFWKFHDYNFPIHVNHGYRLDPHDGAMAAIRDKYYSALAYPGPERFLSDDLALIVENDKQTNTILVYDVPKELEFIEFSLDVARRIGVHDEIRVEWESDLQSLQKGIVDFDSVFPKEDPNALPTIASAMIPLPATDVTPEVTADTFIPTTEPFEILNIHYLQDEISNVIDVKTIEVENCSGVAARQISQSFTKETQRQLVFLDAEKLEEIAGFQIGPILPLFSLAISSQIQIQRATDKFTGIVQGEQQTISETIEVTDSIPPGISAVYTIEWVEKSLVGIIDVQIGDEIGAIGFTIPASLTPNILDPALTSCDS